MLNVVVVVVVAGLDFGRNTLPVDGSRHAWKIGWQWMHAVFNLDPSAYYERNCVSCENEKKKSKVPYRSVQTCHRSKYDTGTRI
eukprot:scaffold1982_cov93-Amphora_coffeaeformis.AAC.26